MNNADELKKDEGLSVLDVVGISVVIVGCMVVSAPLMLLKGILGDDATTLLYYVVSMGIALMYIHRGKSLRKYTFRFDKPLVMVLLVTALLGLQLGITTPIVSTIPMPDFIRDMFMRLAQKQGLFGLITLVVAAPILEELIFRGIVLEGLLKRYSPIKSILISALFFGLIHLNPWQLISAFVIGIVMGWVYYRTRNLLLPIFLHFVNNLTFTLLSKYAGPESVVDMSLSELFGSEIVVKVVIVVSVIVGAISLYVLNGMLPKPAEIIVEGRENGEEESIVKSEINVV
jgi:hypothetical protein